MSHQSTTLLNHQALPWGGFTRGHLGLIVLCCAVLGMFTLVIHSAHGQNAHDNSAAASQASVSYEQIYEQGTSAFKSSNSDNNILNQALTSSGQSSAQGAFLPRGPVVEQ